MERKFFFFFRLSSVLRKFDHGSKETLTWRVLKLGTLWSVTPYDT